MQRLYIGYVIYTHSVRYGVIEKLLYNRCYRYATRIHGPYFNNLSRVFYTKASGMHMPRICALSFILYSLFIKYFKFIYNLKKICIRAAYIQTQRGLKLSVVRKLVCKFGPRRVFADHAEL